MGEYVQMVAGATLTASELLKSGDTDVSIAWDGGRYGKNSVVYGTIA